jgi:probable F420-dependent oxidoreductase
MKEAPLTPETHAEPAPMQIGLVLPIAEGENGTLSYPELRAYALRAEARGFDSLWVVDHLLFRFPERPTRGIWECWSVLAALAEATERLTLGTLVACTAFRNPAVLAKQAASVDAISGGRLILGLGAGWHQPEFDAFGIPFDHTVSRFDEALQIIVPLLREGRVDFRGRYYRAENCELRPGPARPGGPPILIGAFKPRTLALTARHADLWNTCWLGRPDLLPERRAALEAACVAEGRDPASLGVTVGVSVAGPGHTRTDLDPAKVLAGSPAAVADGLLAYQAQGVRHVICSLEPATLEAVDWLAEALPSVSKSQI